MLQVLMMLRRNSPPSRVIAYITNLHAGVARLLSCGLVVSTTCTCTRVLWIRETLHLEHSTRNDISWKCRRRRAKTGCSISESGQRSNYKWCVFQKLLRLFPSCFYIPRYPLIVVQCNSLMAQRDNVANQETADASLVASKNSQTLANEALKDGRNMRRIAIITLIFLPATFVAVRHPTL
jgi:hypothetical protein